MPTQARSRPLPPSQVVTNPHTAKSYDSTLCNSAFVRRIMERETFMPVWLPLILVIVAFVLLQWLLPRFGIPT